MSSEPRQRGADGSPDELVDFIIAASELAVDGDLLAKERVLLLKQRRSKNGVLHIKALPFGLLAVLPILPSLVAVIQVFSKDRLSVARIC